MENKRAQFTCNSFIFYSSFYEAISELSKEQQAEVYDAVFRYGFEGIETELAGVSKAIFALIRPQLVANRAKYENGCRGGRPKQETESKPTNNQKCDTDQKQETESKPNQNLKETESKPTNNLTVTEIKPNSNLTITKPNSNLTITKPNSNLTITKPEPNVNDNVNVNDNYNIAAIAADKAKQVLLNNAGAGARDCCVLNDPEKTAFLKSTFTNISGSLEIMYVAEAGAYGNTNQSSILAGVLKHILETDQDDELQNATRSMTPKTFCAILQRMHDKPIANLEEYAKRVILGEYSMQDTKQCS